nr:hypothetical protein [Tanacetum cinerariifolium]
METASGSAATPSEVKGNVVTTTCDVIAITDLKKPLKDSADDGRGPIGLESCATWDRDSITWEGWDKGVRTVSMGASVQECRVREVEFRRENGWGTVGGCYGVWGNGRKSP